MKYLALVPLVFVASCASRSQLSIRPAPPSVNPVESVRYAEVVRAYHVGRQVDPNHPELMSEGHPVFRVEVSPRWNLHPGSPNTVNPLNPPTDVAYSPSPTNDAVIAELNRQRETTALVMQQAARLGQSYQQLNQLICEMKTVAQNNATLNARLTATEQRLCDFEKQLGKDSSASTNDVSHFSLESNDFHKP